MTNLEALSGEGEPNGRVYGYAGQSYTDTLTGTIWARGNNQNAGTFGWEIKNFPTIIKDMPKSDPHIVGALWNNSGVVNISAG